jgi:adenylate kinase family enzyme
VPHINIGDLLHAEVQRKTPLGVEAQTFMHGSRTVPDRCAAEGRLGWRADEDQGFGF